VHERLYRSRDDRVLFGVAGGMAEYFDLDSSIVRLVWALLVVLGGAGLLLYIIAAIVIPEEPYGRPAAGPAGTDPATGGALPPGAVAGTPGPAGAPPVGQPQPAMDPWTARAQARAARRAARRANHGPSSGGLVIGAILILVGGWFLLKDLLPNFDDALVGPALLIVLGLLLVVAAVRRPMPPAPPAPPAG
jgi:phage shock protein PspC (stress-responsive transcriptional regulator)